MLKIAVLSAWFIMSPGHGPYGEMGSFPTQVACAAQLAHMPELLILLDKHKSDFQCQYGPVSGERKHL